MSRAEHATRRQILGSLIDRLNNIDLPQEPPCAHVWQCLGYDRGENSVSVCRECGEVSEQ